MLLRLQLLLQLESLLLVGLLYHERLNRVCDRQVVSAALSTCLQMSTGL